MGGVHTTIDAMIGVSVAKVPYFATFAAEVLIMPGALPQLAVQRVE